MKNILKVILAAGYISLISVSGCQVSQATERGPSRPTPDMLMRAFRRDQPTLIVYPGQPAALAARYRNWVLRVRGHIPWMTLDSRPADSVTAADLLRGPVFLLGTPASNPWLAQWMDKLPVSMDGAGFTFDERTYADSAILHLSLFPHPLNDSLPIRVLMSRTDESLLAYLSQDEQFRPPGIFARGWHYRVIEQGENQVVGNFGDDWRLDHRIHYDFSALMHHRAKGKYITIEAPASMTPAQVRDVQDSLEMHLVQIAQFTGRQLPGGPIAVKLYENQEILGLVHQVADLGFVREMPPQLHMVADPDFQANQVGTENVLFVRSLLGRPDWDLMEEGLAIWFTTRWQRLGWRTWAARLVRSHNSLTLAELLNPSQLETESPIIRGAMMAALTGFLIDTWGKEVYLSRYATWKPTSAEVATLQTAWDSWLTALADGTPVPATRPVPTGYFKGMTLAHEGYGIYDGYGSSQSAASLARIRAIHGNSIALVPYSGSRSINKPAAFRISNRAGSETDIATATAHFQARKLGMSTLLKPQIWFPGHWPGDVMMQSEADWQQFFMYYRRWIRHYAILAEVYEMDMLCAGVEFVHTTRTHPEAWRSLIRDLRQLYSGPVTYAANWGEEFEKLAFADELDAVGINCYYPLAATDSATDTELRVAFDKVCDMIGAQAARWHKPILFTEIGFRSVVSPWKHPHAEPENDRVNHSHQARCYQVVTDALRGRDWCRGIYWWKWPSYLGYTAEDPQCYAPLGKPAEGIIAAFYQQIP